MNNGIAAGVEKFTLLEIGFIIEIANETWPTSTARTSRSSVNWRGEDMRSNRVHAVEVSSASMFRFSCFLMDWFTRYLIHILNKRTIKIHWLFILFGHTWGSELSNNSSVHSQICDLARCTFLDLKIICGKYFVVVSFIFDVSLPPISLLFHNLGVYFHSFTHDYRRHSGMTVYSNTRIRTKTAINVYNEWQLKEDWKKQEKVLQKIISYKSVIAYKMFCDCWAFFVFDLWLFFFVRGVEY